MGREEREGREIKAASDFARAQRVKRFRTYFKYPNPVRNPSSAVRVSVLSASRARLETAYLSQRVSTDWIKWRLAALR